MELLTIPNVVLRKIIHRLVYYYEKSNFRFRYERICLERDQATPLTALSIEINSTCNRKCLWCPNSMNNRPKVFLEQKLLFKIIDDARKMHFQGAVKFNLFNEPLLDNRIISFIKYTRERLPFSFIYINTNGDILNLELWKNMRKEGLDYANISQYDKKINRNVQIIFDNIDWREKRHFNAYIFDPEKNPQLVYNRAGLVHTTRKVNLFGYCSRPFSELCVNYEGTGVLCCNDYYGQVVIGDVAKKSIQELWQSEILMHYRRELLKPDRTNLKLCNVCDW